MIYASTHFGLSWSVDLLHPLSYYTRLVGEIDGYPRLVTIILFCASHIISWILQKWDYQAYNFFLNILVNAIPRQVRLKMKGRRAEVKYCESFFKDINIVNPLKRKDLLCCMSHCNIHPIITGRFEISRSRNAENVVIGFTSDPYLKCHRYQHVLRFTALQISLTSIRYSLVVYTVKLRGTLRKS